VDTTSQDRPEEGQAVRRDVDRPTPGPFDASAGQGRQERPQTGLGAGGGRGVVGEAAVEPPSESDRAGAAAHQDASVVRRPEVVDEHAPVRDRLAVGPADLLEQVGNRLG
jgi:hypothetical protein